jgi:NAD(P)-dependent dehydrogenase (short-subunit alcohol dehydrogenase family)
MSAATSDAESPSAAALDLTDKCVVVTGGGHGIGRALAEAFADRGGRVVVADVHADRAAKIADRIGGTSVVCDVGDPEQIRSLAETAERAYGPVEVFCSNAGIGDLGPDLGSTVEQIRTIVDVNQLSHVWAAQQVLPGMIERGHGYIVQTISSASLITGPSGLGYTMTKHAALGFAEWLALNHRHLGIRVTCLCPNAVNTGMLGRNEDDESASEDRSADPVIANIGEVVEPETCAAMTLEAMAEGRFLVLPHPRVARSFQRKADDYDGWIAYTNERLRRMRGEDV